MIAHSLAELGWAFATAFVVGAGLFLARRLLGKL